MDHKTARLALVGCLLNVSASMRNVLETGKGDERAIERVQAVLHAALRLARTDQLQDHNALMFISAFGLHNERTPVVDLCGLIYALLDDTSGRKNLIRLVKEKNVPHVSRYIRTDITEHEACVVYSYLQRHKEEIQEFIDAILSQGGTDRIENAKSIAADAVGGHTLLDDLRPYMFGCTPMMTAMGRALSVFREKSDIEQSALVIISDGNSTGGDPLQSANQLKQEKVTIANVVLTDDKTIPRSRLYDQKTEGRFNQDHQNLFNMASKIAVTKHPVPVLASMGWKVPSSEEYALYAEFWSSDTIGMFSSVLLSARFGSADALLDILGRVRLDAYIDDAHMRTRNNPSGQKGSDCCAHAIAAVYHMALLRIVNREGGCPSIAEIRERILQKFPAEPEGRNIEEVLNNTIGWYRPLRFTSMKENGARQAVLQRWPVTITFCLSDSGWKEFDRHFSKEADTRCSILIEAEMATNTSRSDDIGHAVVLVCCGQGSLTFLNSWGYAEGNNSSFNVENPAVLQFEGALEWDSMCFYDVFWYEEELTLEEKHAYASKLDGELEMQCPLWGGNSCIGDFTCSMRLAVCPHCRRSFRPEPGHLMQALYVRAGLDII
ncbi:hypothetical protein COCSADRAFT_166614 [Bipolaris sorokiniana ND90Pr]|uniref:VWFA domain-containing protein n=1 Tax=Cochliobolus sativus (strain ND90Pr / ATCC 201652) TaxID=665912 RepID=M2SQX0_COCSN|nr:uncharacterized protein COCSADRAFT_166614 [Bipolaris sorokiniana ND90Pr]EMD69638.1 hypothetical protein COCSADRAFT_166614 [Bipolaris sorokiniana ND90Pr]